MCRRGALIFVALLVLGGCQLRADVIVAVNDNGSGQVTVAVGLDDDGLEKAPEFTKVRTDDVAAAGWTVTGPQREADGFTWFRASKPFANPTEAGQILNEISGPEGPFEDFTVSHDRSFATTDYGVEGTVDLTRGPEAFSDSALAAQLDGKPLGDDVAAISQRIGQPLDDVFAFRVVVQLPGSMSSNGSQFGNAAVWEPQFSDTAPVSVSATSTARRWPTVIGVVVIAAAVIGLVVWLTFAASRREAQPYRQRRTVTPPQ